MTVISFPIPPFSNLPIEPQNYQPSQFFISNIILGNTTLVAATEDMNYVIGQEVRLIIPPYFGCRQLNQQTGFVISIPSANEVILDVDSSQNVDPFISSSASTQSQIIAIGDINTGPINSNGRSQTSTILQGSFINISPHF